MVDDSWKPRVNQIRVFYVVTLVSASKVLELAKKLSLEKAKKENVRFVFQQDVFPESTLLQGSSHKHLLSIKGLSSIFTNSRSEDI